jgi:hypothetical protein
VRAGNTSFEECSMRNPPKQSHGMNTLKQAVSTLGRRTVDKRTTVGKQLAAWRSDLLADLGGIEAVSTQELALVEEAVKTKLLLNSAAGWMLTQPSLVDKRKRALLPVVRDYQALVNVLRGLLTDLGLKRRSRELPSLAQYVASKADSTAKEHADADVSRAKNDQAKAKTDGGQTTE